MTSTPEPQEDAPSAPIWGPALARCWKGVCPRCAEGTVFAKRFRLREDCESCGLLFRKDHGSMTGQMYVSAAVTEIFATAIILGVYLLTDWGAVLSISVGLPLVVIFSYALLPRTMAFWVGVEYATNLSNEAQQAAMFKQSEKPRD